ncbi:MAG: hypothetical protein ABJA49_12785, partial [Betaproteobacteria bacterium]
RPWPKASASASDSLESMPVRYRGYRRAERRGVGKPGILCDPANVVCMNQNEEHSDGETIFPA